MGCSTSRVARDGAGGGGKPRDLRGLVRKIESEDSSLTSVELRNAGIDDSGAGKLAHALQINTVVTDLVLNCNDITDQGARALGSLLEGSTSSLRRLSLRDNPIGDGGASALAAALRTNPHMTALSLPFCGVSDEGAAALAGALRSPTCALVELHLNGNQISDVGAKQLAAALLANANASSLTALSLDKNHITDAGAAALAGAVERGRTLRMLTLNGNVDLSYEARVRVRKAGMMNYGGKDGKSGFGTMVKDAKRRKSAVAVLGPGAAGAGGNQFHHNRGKGGAREEDWEEEGSRVLALTDGSAGADGHGGGGPQRQYGSAAAARAAAAKAAAKEEGGVYRAQGQQQGRRRSSAAAAAAAAGGGGGGSGSGGGPAVEMLALKADLAGNLDALQQRLQTDAEEDVVRRQKKKAGKKKGGAKVAVEQVPTATLR